MTFPSEPITPIKDDVIFETYGLTKREYFAAMAMQGLLSSCGQYKVTAYNEIASDCVLAADALIEELNK